MPSMHGESLCCLCVCVCVLCVTGPCDRAYGEPEGQRKIQVRTFGLSESSRMRDLDPENIDQLLCLKGMVVRCSPVIPDLKQAFFRWV